jgi:threonine dehydratase
MVSGIIQTVLFRFMKAQKHSTAQGLPKEIVRAAERIGPYILETPLMPSPWLSELSGGEVWLKLESEQHTGSFKARGALNKVLAMTAEEKAAGLVTASTGNHAQGFARALSISGDRGLIYLPENAEPSKVAALRHYGVELAFHGRDCLQTELYARQQAEAQGRVWVSPYNDPLVIAGQGTIGREILRREPGIDTVLATVGGGGLISGIGAWFRAERPAAEIIGCLPENAPEMYLSVKKGELVVLDEPLETLSDGSAGGCEPGAITFDLCRELVDDYRLVSEAGIGDAIRWMADKHHKIIEGAAGVALGAFLQEPRHFRDRKVAIVICGANISLEKLKGIL